MGSVVLPTWRGILFFLLSAAASAVALVNSGLITAFTASVLDTLFLSSFFMSLFAAAGMKLERRFPQNGYCGQNIEVTFTLENKLPFYRMGYTILEDHPFVVAEPCAFAAAALAPRERRTFTCQIKAEKRGEFQLKKVFLCGGDPLGLFRKRKKFLLPAEVAILPQIRPLDSLLIADKTGSMPDAEGRNLGRAGKGTEFFGVRPYRFGDEVRHIHWKSTAAKGELMVKEFEASAVDEIVILLDTGKKAVSLEPCSNNLEFLISCAASIAEHLSQRYCHLHLFAADGARELHHISGDAAAVKNRILQTLTLLSKSDLSLKQVLASVADVIPKRSTIYLLTLSREGVPEYIELLEEQDSCCFWIYAPAEHFPLIEKEKPRIVRREKINKILKQLPVMPLTADFSTGAEILEGPSSNEKI